MYLLICSLFFIAFSLHRPHRVEWLIVAAVACFIWANVHAFDFDGVQLYRNRSAIMFFGASALCFRRSLLGYYQSSIFVMTLCAFWALEYDVEQGTSIIYDNYEAVIYGLVGCHFVGAFPTLRAAYRDLAPGRGSRMADILRSKA